MSEDKPDAKELRRLYHNKGLTQSEIGDKYEVSARTISSWMKELGVESRNRSEQAVKQHREGPANLQMTQQGYERFTSMCNGEEDVLLHHHLLADYNAIPNRIRTTEKQN